MHYHTNFQFISLVRHIWRSTFVLETIFRRSFIRLKQTDRTCWTIQTHSDELNRARRQTFHELNSISLVYLIKISPTVKEAWNARILTATALQKKKKTRMHCFCVQPIITMYCLIKSKCRTSKNSRFDKQNNNDFCWTAGWRNNWPSETIITIEYAA